MSDKPLHTVKRDDGWANIREGADRASKLFGTQQEAIEAGRKTAVRDGVEHLIHNREGRIRDRNSYGKDPHPPKG